MKKTEAGLMKSKRFKQKSVGEVFQEKSTNPLRRITWSDIIFAIWGGAAAFHLIQLVYNLAIPGIR